MLIGWNSFARVLNSFHNNSPQIDILCFLKPLLSRLWSQLTLAFKLSRLITIWTSAKLTCRTQSFNKNRPSPRCRMSALYYFRSMQCNRNPATNKRLFLLDMDYATYDRLIKTKHGHLRDEGDCQSLTTLSWLNPKCAADSAGILSKGAKHKQVILEVWMSKRVGTFWQSILIFSQ